MTDLQKKLFSAFESEYQSILGSIRALVTRLEDTGEPLVGASLNEAFRMAHTLKGSAHVVGFPTIVTLAHRLESFFAKVRDGHLSIEVAEIRLIHSILDAVEDIVSAFKKGATLPDVQPLIQTIEALLNGTPLPTAQIPPAAPKLVAVPAVGGAVVVETSPAHSASESETVRLNAANLDQLLGTAGELLSVLRVSRQVDAKISGVSNHLGSLHREWELLRRSSAGLIQKMNQTPEFARVAQFLEFVGAELNPLIKEIQATREASKQSEWDLRSLGERLQEDVRKARVVTAETVLGGFNKMVRDLASDLGRKVDFRFIGADVEADRVVLQALKDPLMHMLRNSVGHGIEPKDVRERDGKDPIGKIFVRIQASGGRLTVVVEDDGRGLNEETIRERAVANGLVQKSEAASLSPDDLTSLIFRPGFSTATEVSDLSGRGMGMSVVAETVQRLQGSIKVDSQAGHHLKFTISVPISLLNHRLILVHHASQTYAIPCRNIDSLRRVKKEELRTVEGKPSILVNDVPVPILSIGTVLGLHDASVKLSGDLVSLVVLRLDDRHIALAVDSISDECESIIKNMGSPFRRQKIFSGAILQGDGQLALVFDPPELFNQMQKQESPRAAILSIQQTSSRVARDGKLRVLVVDDSITTRTLEKGILEANGYKVSLAVDGLDALNKLQLETFDLVISDVEMPRMDGFTLVAEIKKHPKFSNIPVIMVTSLEKPEDKARGLALGASAYVLKQKFDQGDLLETIRRVA